MRKNELDSTGNLAQTTEAQIFVDFDQTNKITQSDMQSREVLFFQD